LLLSIIQLILNIKILNITKIILYFANYKQESNLFEREQKHLATQLVIEKIEILKKIHNNIIKMQNKFAIY
jgi:hypothetical protein